MKIRASVLIATLTVLTAIYFMTGCGFTEQRRAYERAVTAEQQATPEHFAEIVAQYEQVARMHPGTKWADKAEEHAKALRAKLSSDELHKSVFQEHGVD